MADGGMGSWNRAEHVSADLDLTKPILAGMDLDGMVLMGSEYIFDRNSG